MPLRPAVCCSHRAPPDALSSVTAEIRALLRRTKSHYAQLSAETRLIGPNARPVGAKTNVQSAGFAEIRHGPCGRPGWPRARAPCVRVHSHVHLLHTHPQEPRPRSLAASRARAVRVRAHTQMQTRARSRPPPAACTCARPHLRARTATPVPAAAAGWQQGPGAAALRWDGKIGEHPAARSGAGRERAELLGTRLGCGGNRKSAPEKFTDETEAGDGCGFDVMAMNLLLRRADGTAPFGSRRAAAEPLLGLKPPCSAWPWGWEVALHAVGSTWPPRSRRERRRVGGRGMGGAWMHC